MKRLTLKNKDWACQLTTPMYDKLHDLEDIEEKIGIDLITLFEAFNGIYYIKDGKIKFACHIAIVDWKIYILEESFEIDAKKGFCVGLNDYGKAWALTREELK